MRKIEETDNISEMVLASFTDKEMQQDISISRILSFPGLEIHLKEQTVYKHGVRVHIYRCDDSAVFLILNSIKNCSFKQMKS